MALLPSIGFNNVWDQSLNKMLCFQLIIESMYRTNVWVTQQKVRWIAKISYAGWKPLNFRRILINFLQCKIIENILGAASGRRVLNLWESRKFHWKFSAITFSFHCHRARIWSSHITSHISLKFPFKGGTE